MSHDITNDILRQVFALYSDRQLAEMRQQMIQADIRRWRRAQCVVCRGTGNVRPDDGVYRQFNPCSACSVEPNPSE